MTNANVLCRFCLTSVPVAYSVLNNNILSTVIKLTSLAISSDDSLPKLSCSSCILNIYFVDSVRRMVIQSHEKLVEVLNKEGNFNNLLTNCEKNSRDYILKDNSDNIKEEPSLSASEQLISKKFSDEVFDEKEIKGNENNFKKQCQKANTSHENKIIIRKTNTKPYLYFCTVCNVDFYGIKNYMKHKGKHEKKTCEICGITLRKDNYFHHFKDHKLGQQICQYCGSTHKSYRGLKTHIFHFHNKNKKGYTCQECGITFKYCYRLTHHNNKIHKDFRPHQCEKCGKSFYNVPTLKKHIKLIHSKLREHQCEYCKKNYTSRYALKVHRRQHTDETPYVCEFCSEGFRQKVSLKTHLKSKHGCALPSETLGKCTSSQLIDNSLL